jgi:peptidoglycan/LPS O-acetylase OafA/YrhL
MSRRELLPALTPLRFPAAFSAVLFHVWVLLKGPGGRPAPQAVWHLWAGVSFFFVLSGFILTYNYLDEFRRPTRRGVWNFLVARWARTYPVHVLGVLIMLPIDYPRLIAGVFGNPYISVLTQVFLGQAFLPMETPKANAFNSPSWSLSAEWFFYLTLPVLIPALTSGSLRRRAAVVLLALTPWLLAVVGLFGWNVLGPITPYRYPPVRLADFLAGVLLAMAWHRRHGASAPPVRSVSRATAAEVGALFVLGVWVWVLIRTVTKLKWLMATGWLGVYVPPLLLLVWVLARGGGLVSRALASRPLAYLGDISFALYMLHLPILLYFHIDGHRIGAPSWWWLWKWLAVMGTSFVLAMTCYHLYEIPLRDWLRRKLTIRRPGPAPVPPVAEPVPEVPTRRAA